MAPRRKVRQREAQLAFEALSIEGGLISPEWLARVAQLDAGHQAEADYRIPKGLNLRDEIGRYWRMAQAHWGDFARACAAGSGTKQVAEQFVTALLKDCLGFGSLAARAPVTVGDRTYPLVWAALEGRVPIVIVAPHPSAGGEAGSALDDLLSELGDAGRRRSAFGLAQEYLNAEEDALWAIVSDGLTLRLCRDNASLTRPAWIEADLDRIFREERYSDFAALWLLAHETRFGAPGQLVSACHLEAWRAAGREEGTRAREFLRDGVEEALQALGRGFLANPDNQELRAALHDGKLSANDYFQELLRLVYRLIFLLTAEERDLLHPAGVADAVKARYAQGYGLRRLRDRAVKRSAHDRFGDVWEGLKIVLRGVATGEPRLGLPALGGLFSASQCPHLDAARLENRALLTAVFRLSWLKGDSGLARVNWRDMGPEELGSVYESLLELVPVIPPDHRGFSFATGDETKGNARKTTGSYYTPDSLVQVLLDSALEPVIQATVAAHPEDPFEALLKLSIVDPACGSGHFLLAAARRLAVHVARFQAKGTPSAEQYRHAVRQVVSRCLFGVDLNPMAVELCRVSLWMEAVEPGRPLSFLNSHIQLGNALLGTTPELMAKGIPDEAFEPIEGDDKSTASYLKKKNKAAAEGQRGLESLWSKPEDQESAEVAMAVAALDAAPDVDLAAVSEKEKTWSGLQESKAYQHQKFVADAWCAAFVWPKPSRAERRPPGAHSPSQAFELDAAPTNDLWRQIRDSQGSPPPHTVRTVAELAKEYRFFHWHLAFPQVVARGGFDLVLGNPPWDILRPDVKEFFSAFEPSIRSQSRAEQDATVARLTADATTAEAWRKRRREVFATVAFLKMSGRFRLFAPGNLGKGDFNVYRLFIELALTATRNGGWAAQIVPDGLYSGANCMAIRKELFEAFRLEVLLAFENTRGAWFPGVHQQTKFALYAAKKGGATTSFRTAFGLRSESELRSAVGGRALVYSVATVREASPEALAIIDLRSEDDLALVRKLHRAFPALGVVEEGAWRRAYLRELESGHVQELLTEDSTGLPHYEGRMIAQYDHRAKGYRSGRARSAVWEDLSFDLGRKAVSPQWYVPENRLPGRAAERVGKYRVAFCGVTSATTERTLVAAMLPQRCIAGDTVPTVVIESGQPLVDLLVWLAVANSIVMDYMVRMRVGLHVSLTVLDSLPFARLAAGGPDEAFLASRALRLTCTAPEMYGLWDQMADRGLVDERAATTGPPGAVAAEERLILAAEIDARVAHLYGVSRPEFEHILDSFSMLRKVELESFGEYRTKRVILNAFDAMAEAIRTGKPYQTRLSPPPADPRVAHPPREGGKVIPLRVTATGRPRPVISPAAAAVPDLATVAANAWTRPHAMERGEIQAAILAVLAANGSPMDRRQARLAALLCLEPHLLAAMLDKIQTAQWIRVVGDDAKKVASASIDVTAQEWGAALTGLRGRGRLLEDLQQNTWALGTGTEAIDMRGWPEGRAGFVVNVVRRRQGFTPMDAIILTLPTNVQEWLADAA